MANLSNFGENAEVMKEGMAEANEDKRDKLAFTVQMPINFIVMIKRNLLTLYFNS